MPRSFTVSTCCISWFIRLYEFFGFFVPILNIKDLLRDIFRPQSFTHELRISIFSCRRLSCVL
ncbi:unnamed protein product [Meloidogyne enterolobii]|uniref:Uncharacterized protein n=1 Tax=Meloidogyne enterolobii TaxID=390850 RepID=A0ACB1B9R0_MELEN